MSQEVEALKLAKFLEKKFTSSKSVDQLWLTKGKKDDPVYHAVAMCMIKTDIDAVKKMAPFMASLMSSRQKRDRVRIGELTKDINGKQMWQWIINGGYDQPIIQTINTGGNRYLGPCRNQKDFEERVDNFTHKHQCVLDATSLKNVFRGMADAVRRTGSLDCLNTSDLYWISCFCKPEWIIEFGFEPLMPKLVGLDHSTLYVK